LFALRDRDEIIQTKSVPQEEQRLQAPQALISRTVQNLNECIQRCTTELVFNLDEVVISDWEDGKSRKVVVRATMRPDDASVVFL
jgi:uncharacterized FlaG/YvyC family protein